MEENFEYYLYVCFFIFLIYEKKTKKTYIRITGYRLRNGLRFIIDKLLVNEDEGLDACVHNDVFV